MPATLPAQHPLVAVPLDDPAYVQLAGLERQGCNAARVSAFRPYTTTAIRASLRRAVSEPLCAGAVLTRLLERFGDRDPADPARTDSIAVDTLRGIAADLAAAARSAAQDDDDGTLHAGAALTLRATTLSKGDFQPRWKDVVPTAEGTPPLVGIFRGRLTWSPDRRVVAVAQAYAQSHRRNDPRIRSRSFRRTSGSVDFDEAYLSGAVGRKVLLSLGRAREAWLGRDEESLVLSAHGPSLDRFLAAVTTKHFEARAIVASLNSVVLDTLRDSIHIGLPDQRFYRWLVGHALVWRPVPRLEFTIGETALLSRGSRAVDVAYLNPLMVYVVTQNDSGRAGEDNRDNLTVFGAARLQAGMVGLTGELLIDDIQIDAADRERTPDQLGGRVAATFALPLVIPASLVLEYRRVGSYTYMRRNYNEVYQNYDHPLGSELGPDADEFRASGELWPGGTLRLGGSVGVWRRGVLRIDQRPGQRATGNADKPFPSVEPGTYVQRATVGEVTAQWLTSRLPVTARVEAARIENANNELQGSALYLRAQVIGTYAFRFP